MKIKKSVFLIFFVLVVLAFISFRLLNQSPVVFLVLKKDSGTVRVFEVKVFLTYSPAVAEEIPLNRVQAVEAEKILTGGDERELKIWSQGLGAFPFVVGFPADNGDWSSCWKIFFSSIQSGNGFSNMTWADRLYFMLVLCPRLGLIHETPVSGMPIFLPTPVSISATPNLTPAPLSTRIAHVEILNGCGIKGAAEIVAIRLRSPSLLADKGGNARNFSYSQSKLLASTAAESSVEEALVKMGFGGLNVAVSGDLPSGYDAVFIVGKDFQKIKGK